MWGEAWGSPAWSFCPCGVGVCRAPRVDGLTTQKLPEAHLWGFYGSFSHRRPGIGDPTSRPSYFSRRPSEPKSARCRPGPAPPGARPRSPQDPPLPGPVPGAPKTRAQVSRGAYGGQKPCVHTALPPRDWTGGNGTVSALAVEADWAQRAGRRQLGSRAGHVPPPRPAGSTLARAVCPESL